MLHGIMSREIADRFWSKVAVGSEDECWLWQAATFSGRYGAFQVGPRAIGAHRVAYELTHGPLKPGEWVLHSCDVKQCVNPAHLRAGTHEDNMRDLAERGEGKNQHKGKTHCKHGHEFTLENTYRRPGMPQRRYCLTCKKRT